MKRVFITFLEKKKKSTVSSVLSLNCNVLVSEGRMEAKGQHRHRALLIVRKKGKRNKIK